MSKKISIIILSVLISNFIYSQDNDIGNLLSQAKKHYSDRNSLGPNRVGAVKRSIDCLEQALTINPNHKEANELSREINLEIALKEFETGKWKLEKYYDFTLHQERYNGWYDGVYFYTALTHFANAYKSGLDSTLISNYVREIDSIGKLVDENFISLTNDNLYIMSTSFQLENYQKIENLKRVIQVSQDTLDKLSLFDLYTQLVDLEKFNYEMGKFQSYDYKQARIERAKLAVELGNVDDGCLELYTIDYLNFGRYRSLCEEWHDKYSAQQHKKYIEEEKEKATQWYKDNPEMIKFLSLFEKSFDIVEAFLGKPILKQYKIDVGVGWKGEQFIGNKYQNKQGIYEIGFINGNVHFIKFTPTIYLSFSTAMMKYMGEESRFDFKSEVGGMCGIEQSSGNIGNITTYTINLDCSKEDETIIFYGSNGKIISVIAFY
jgi:hypothetical protein